MGNKNEGYLGGIMGGASRVGSGTATTGTKKTVQDLTLHNQLSLVGDKVDMGFTDSVSNAYFSLTPGSGYQYLEVRYNADSSSRKRFVLGLVEAASSTNNTQGQHSYSRGLWVDNSTLRRAGSSLPSTYGSLDYILAMLLNLDTGDVYMSICDPGNAPVWVREDNTESTTFDVANPTFSGLDLTTLDTVFTQLAWNETYMNFNFGGNPLFDGEETSGNDSSTWYNDPPVSVVSFGQQEVTLKVANTGILSLEEAGTQTVETSNIPDAGDLSLTDGLTLVSGSEVDHIGDGGLGASNSYEDAYITIPPGSGYVYAEVHMVASSETFLHQAFGLIKSTEIDNSQYGQNPQTAYTIRRNGTSYYRQDGTTNTVPNTVGGRSAVNTYHLLINRDTGDVWIAITPDGQTFRYLNQNNAMSLGFASNVPTFSNVDLSVYDTFYFQQYYTTQSAWVNFGGNPLFNGQLSSGNDSSDWFRDPPVSVSASSFTSGTAETRTLPQLSWGGITGRSVLTEGSAAVPPYEIGHSLDFDGSNDYLTRSQTTPTEPKKWTWSGWVKNQGTGEQVLLAAKTQATGQALVEFISNQRFGVRRWTGSTNDLNTFTASTYTDSTVWNHFVVAYDSTAQSVEIWVNGQLESLVSGGGGTAVYPSLNQTISLSDGSENHYVGARGQLSYWFDGQLAENHFIDGQALTASDFGQSVSGAWYPKAYSGTYGNNGFYLDFADNSTTAALGNDVSGNGNDFTVNNMTTGDQTTDVPAAVPGDDDWNDVTLLLDGSDPTDDLSNTNQDASITNTGSVASVSVTGPTGYGTVDALSFNGSNYLTTSHYGTSANLYNQDFTIEGWFYLPSNPYTAASTNAILFGHRTVVGDFQGVTAFLEHTNNNVALVVGDDATWAVLELSTGVSFKPNDWQHIAVTRENDTYRLFHDGAEIVTATSNATVAVSGDFVLMAATSSGDIPCPGNVFDFRITEGVARYTGPFTPPTESFPTSLPVAATPDTLVNTGIFTLEEIYELNKST